MIWGGLNVDLVAIFINKSSFDNLGLFEQV